MSALKLSFVLEAVDRATSRVRAVNERISRMTQPAQRVRAALGALAVESGLPRVAAQAQVLDQRLGKLRSTAMLTATAFGGLFFGLTRFANGGDVVIRTAQRLALSTREFQRLAAAADQLGDMPQEQFADALRNLGRQAVMAAGGSAEATRWFQLTGIEVLDAAGKVKRSNVLFRELADRFKTMPDGPLKTAIAMGLMRNAGDDMINTLNAGAAAIDAAGDEAERLGRVLSDDALKDMARFDESFKLAKASIFGVVAAIAGPLLPALTDLMTRLREWLVVNRELVASRLLTVVKVLAVLLAGKLVLSVISTTVALVKLGLGIARLVPTIFVLTKAVLGFGLALLTTPIGWITLAIVALVGLAVLVVKKWEPIKAFFTGLWEGVKGAFSSAVDWIWSRITAVTEAVKSAIVFLDGLIPDWAKRILPGGPLISLAADAVRESSAVPSAIPPRAAAAGAGSFDAGGVLQIKIDQEGRARVVGMRPNSPAMAFDVDAGPIMVGP